MIFINESIYWHGTGRISNITCVKQRSKNATFVGIFFFVGYFTTVSESETIYLYSNTEWVTTDTTGSIWKGVG